jgi:hypothetical protein
MKEKLIGIKKYPKLDLSGSLRELKIDYNLLPERHTYTTQDAYTLYKKSVEFPLTKKEYMIIIKEFSLLVYDLLVESYAIVLPFGLGRVAIKSKVTSFEPNKQGNIIAPVDWQKTNKLWKDFPQEKEKKTKIYFMNEHSEYKSYRISWSKPKIAMKNKSFYHFSLTDFLKDKFTSLIKSGWSM